MTHICPACGYPDLFRAAYDEVGEPSFEICPSCSYQFGYTDDDQFITFEQWRKQWIAGGMVWDSGISKPPPDWNPRKQLLNIGIKI